MSIIRLTPAINSTEARELWTLQNQIGSIISRLECGVWDPESIESGVIKTNTHFKNIKDVMSRINKIINEKDIWFNQYHINLANFDISKVNQLPFDMVWSIKQFLPNYEAKFIKENKINLFNTIQTNFQNNWGAQKKKMFVFVNIIQAFKKDKDEDLDCRYDCLLHQITKKSQATKSGRKDIMDDILLDAFFRRTTAYSFKRVKYEIDFKKVDYDKLICALKVCDSKTPNEIILREKMKKIVKDNMWLG